MRPESTDDWLAGHIYPLPFTLLTEFHSFQDLTVGQFVYVIRKRIKLAPEKAIFIFVDEVLPPAAALMSAIYEEHKYACFAHVPAPVTYEYTLS